MIVLIIIILVILKIIFEIIKKKTLIVILCIDERINDIYTTLSNKTNYNILGVIRKKDKKCKKFFEKIGAKILIVENYETHREKRHNFPGMSIKREAALKYAKENNYLNLIFIDSDIKCNDYIILCLLIGLYLGADITCISYGIRWADMRPMLGYSNPDRISEVKYNIFPYHKCAVCGLGCTAINLKSSKIPNIFPVKTELEIEGEDIGFFLEANKKNAHIIASSWLIAEHI